MDVSARLETVEAENDMLREQIRRLETVLGIHSQVPLEFCLTGSEAAVFGILMARDIATKEMIYFALYASLGKEGVEPKIVDVFVCKMRKKLGRFNISVKTAWGRGYYLEPDAKRAVKLLLEQRAAA